VYDPFARNSSVAGGLSSVSTYKHCAAQAISNEAYRWILGYHPPAEATADNGNFPR
jgi:hypothetical protein